MSSLSMTKDQREAFLAALHVGVLAVARPGGAPPLAAPVWYDYEPGGAVVCSFTADSEKLQLLRDVGAASLCAQTEALPYQYVTVEGPVDIGPSDPAIGELLAHKYLGAELGDAYLAATDRAASRIVRLQPTRWRTVDYARFGGG